MKGTYSAFFTIPMIARNHTVGLKARNSGKTETWNARVRQLKIVENKMF